ncbi:CsbA family protein [Listeria sp. FSL L7-1485]|uniref:CsbA family protein n=1 Tax=Listeria immobilis TaxID=2713502 RepID=A0A7X0X6S3_9LIST|nr:CsbA family protein [Listeria immobilis]MBC1482591.1 CsbA family protein [Listeria immobilis]MBC1488261.1 CsbA family protein [Listeria immobilis]MBC1507235.1 CsbA family protein [Listeria immobilis]MBC1509853.1 CsbA family protein [Listeria immobilis]MBC1516372.1 CsbA family protein [Listeria immobilis]
MDQIISALIFPCLLVILFARITYNRYVALLLMIILIAASAKLGYTSSYWLIVIDAFSMTIGFILATYMLNRLKKRGSDF